MIFVTCSKASSVILVPDERFQRRRQSTMTRPICGGSIHRAFFSLWHGTGHRKSHVER